MSDIEHPAPTHTTDATEWAVKFFEVNPNLKPPTSLDILTWFALAIETGRRAGARKQTSPEVSSIAARLMQHDDPDVRRVAASALGQDETPGQVVVDIDTLNISDELKEKVRGLPDMVDPLIDPNSDGILRRDPVDMIECYSVELQISGDKVWLNVNGICVFRAGRATVVQVEDNGKVRAYRRDREKSPVIPMKGEPDNPYGYCPHCYSPGISRERRPDGYDECSRGHKYRSRDAIPNSPHPPLTRG